MTADVELCKQILYTYADEPCYPTQIQFDDLKELFSDEEVDKLEFNLIALSDAGLLDIEWKWDYTAGLRWVHIKWIHGLKPYIGSEFVAQTRNPKRWNKLTEFSKSVAGEVTLSLVLEAIKASVPHM